jgi:hypothetical protein
MQKPDFSGEYVLNRLGSILSPRAAAFHSAVLRIRHREPLFHYKATFAADEKTFEFEFERAADGREVTDKADGTTTMSKLYWDGRALVLTFRTTTADSEMTMSWRYELLDGESRLEAVEQIRGAGRDQDNVWVFERKGAGDS